MTTYAHVTNGEVDQVGLPNYLELSDGRTVSNPGSLDPATLAAEGWWPVVEGTQPTPGENELVTGPVYTFDVDHVDATYGLETVEPQPEPEPAVTVLDDLADVHASGAVTGDLLVYGDGSSPKILGAYNLYQQPRTIGGGTNDQLLLSLDGVTYETIVVPAGTYTGAGPIAAAAQSAIDASPFAGIVVCDFEVINGVSPQLRLTADRTFWADGNFLEVIAGVPGLPVHAPLVPAGFAPAGAWTTWYPEIHSTLGGSFGGSISAFGRYSLVGKTMRFAAHFEYPADLIAPNAGAFIIYLPTEYLYSQAVFGVCQARLIDADGADPKFPSNVRSYEVGGILMPSPAGVVVTHDGLAVGPDNGPFVWAAGDRIVVAGTIELV